MSNLEAAPDQSVAAFLADVPPAPNRQRPITKAELTTAHHVKMNANHKPITALASTINYIRGQAEEAAQTVYILIDDTTPDGADVPAQLADAYRALARAQQLLFEAQTHMLRFVNVLENERAYNAEMFAEHDPIGNHGI